MLGNKFVCTRCEMLGVCTLAHKALEQGSAASSGLPGIFDVVRFCCRPAP